MNRIYLSGKISGLSEAEYTGNFRNASIDIYSCYSEFDGVEVINPLDIKPLFGIKSWWCYMAADLWQLRKCTHIAVQSNWIDSKGAMIEVFCAKWIFKQQIIWL